MSFVLKLVKSSPNIQSSSSADLKRVIISKSVDDSSAQELLDIVVKSVRVQIDFWERAVLQDIKNLEKALK
jgi:hypothetical protein